MIALVVAIYVFFLALNIWVILIRPARPWKDKFGMLLQIVGLYTFGFTVITKALPDDLASDLTSPDLFTFLAGNSTALSMFSAAMSMALHPAKTSFSAFAFLQLFGTLVLGVLSIACIVLYALVVAPLSYVAYVLVSLPLTAITTSAREISFDMNGQELPIKDIIADNSVVIKNVLISFTALALKMSPDLVNWVRRVTRRGGDPQQLDRVDWLTRHPRTARAVSVGGQAILGLLLFVFVVSAVLLPSLAADDADGPVPIGETVGAEIVTALAIWGLVVLLLRVRRRRQANAAERPAIETAAPV